VQGKGVKRSRVPKKKGPVKNKSSSSLKNERGSEQISSKVPNVHPKGLVDKEKDGTGVQEEMSEKGSNRSSEQETNQTCPKSKREKKEEGGKRPG